MLASAFVAAVRRHGQVTAQVADADILADADLEIQGRYLPLLRGLQAEYLVVTQTLQPDAVLTNRVRLPARAVGAALRLVQIQQGRDWVTLPQVSLEEAQSQASGTPQAYAIDAGTLVLVPEGTSAAVRVRYEARPGTLVLESAANVGALSVVTPNGSSYDITVPGVNATVDIISAGGAHDLLATNVVVAATAGNVGSPFGPVAVGDYASPAGTTPLVPLPEELVSALAHRVAASILRSGAYLAEAQGKEEKADELEALARPLLVPRQSGNPLRLTGGIRATIGQGRAGRVWRP